MRESEIRIETENLRERVADLSRLVRRRSRCGGPLLVMTSGTTANGWRLDRSSGNNWRGERCFGQGNDGRQITVPRLQVNKKKAELLRRE